MEENERREPEQLKEKLKEQIYFIFVAKIC